MMSSSQQQELFANLVCAMGDAEQNIKQRQLQNCTRADPAYGAGVAGPLRSVPVPLVPE